MRGDVIAILSLILVASLLGQAAGAPVFLWLITAVVSWFEAIPAPGEHLASIINAWAWPVAILLIAWWLRDHISGAAAALARRFEKDDLELGGWLKMTSDTSLATLDGRTATTAPDTAEAEDAKIVEMLLEYAGESEDNAQKLRDWISRSFSPTFDPEEFLNNSRFAADRKKAYDELAKG